MSDTSYEDQAVTAAQVATDGPYDPVQEKKPELGAVSTALVTITFDQYNVYSYGDDWPLTSQLTKESALALRASLNALDLS